MRGPFDAAAHVSVLRCSQRARARRRAQFARRALLLGRDGGGGGGCCARREMDSSLEALPSLGAPGVVAFVHVHVHCYEGAGAPTHSVTTRVVGAPGAGLHSWAVQPHPLPRRQPARPHTPAPGAQPSDAPAHAASVRSAWDAVESDDDEGEAPLPRRPRTAILVAPGAASAYGGVAGAVGMDVAGLAPHARQALPVRTFGAIVERAEEQPYLIMTSDSEHFNPGSGSE